MRLTRFTATTLGLSLLFVGLSLLIGCAKKDEDEIDISVGGSKSAVKKTPLSTGTAVLKGHVRLADDKPSAAELNDATTKLQADMRATADAKTCLDKAPQDQKIQQTWSIGPGKGLGNVFVMLRPEKDTYFALKDDHPGIVEAKKGPKKLDQPHCAFVPHALYLVPEYLGEGEKKVATGQFLQVLNTSPVNHNTKWSDDTPRNPGGNLSIGALTGIIDIKDLRPSNSAVRVSCSVHPWMKANVWVLDHPFVAITKEDGSFEIPNVPIGKVRIVAWHEQAELVNAGSKNGETLDLPANGEVVKDFNVSGK